MRSVYPATERGSGYSLVPEELRLFHAEDFRDDVQFAVHLDFRVFVWRISFIQVLFVTG
jgi:hypothetical protein